MAFDIARYWYSKKFRLFHLFFLPFSYLFGLIVAIRRWLYQIGFKKSVRFPVPIIVVGNLTVGGTGKTPFVILLANFLKSQGYRPGIVTRGVGGKLHKSAHLVRATDSPTEIGDEALVLFRNANCPIMIGKDRANAVATLLKSSDCNIIISDDGLQHYRLARDIEIVMIDAARQFGNEYLLPAGPLREPMSRLKSVDFVVVNSSADSASNPHTSLPSHLRTPPPVNLTTPPPVNLRTPPPVSLTTPPPASLRTPPPVSLRTPPLCHPALVAGSGIKLCAIKKMREWLRALSIESDFFNTRPRNKCGVTAIEVQGVATGEAREGAIGRMTLIAHEIVSLSNHASFKIADFPHKKIHAIAGIGNPERFFHSLEQVGFTVIKHPFPDHHHYKMSDLNFADSLPIVMTEKDAVKCEAFADERFWYVPVVATVNESLLKNILTKLKSL